jgi:hypothetical protein
MKRNLDAEPLDAFTQRWAWTVLLSVMPILILFAWLGDSGRGIAAATSVGVFMIVGRVYWACRSNIWFWVVIVAFGLFHIILVFAVHWPGGGIRAFALLPIACVDYLMIYGCLKLVEQGTISTHLPK